MKKHLIQTRAKYNRFGIRSPFAEYERRCDSTNVRHRVSRGRHRRARRSGYGEKPRARFRKQPRAYVRFLNRRYHNLIRHRLDETVNGHRSLTARFAHLSRRHNQGLLAHRVPKMVAQNILIRSEFERFYPYVPVPRAHSFLSRVLVFTTLIWNSKYPADTSSWHNLSRLRVSFEPAEKRNSP